VGDSSHVHSSSPLAASDQVQGAGYSKSEVETNLAALQLENSVTDLELEIDVTTLECRGRRGWSRIRDKTS
jgi:hypothetical protein